MKENEHYECRLLVMYLKRIWCLFSKVANEIWTPSIKQKMFQKAEWLNGGVPDYIIILKCNSWNKKLVFIEMKRKKGWIVSDNQKIRNKRLLESWIEAHITKGAKEAIDIIQMIIANN